MMSNAAMSSPEHTTDADPDRYHEFEARLRDNFKAAVGEGRALFTTDATGLYDMFLDSLPDAQRQYYNCRACRRFVERFGALVTIAPDGVRQSILWWDPDTAPPLFRPGVARMARLVAKAKVSGVFLTSEAVWGVPWTPPNQRPGQPAGGWHHMAVTPPASMAFKHPLKSADQVAAEKREDHGMLCRALDEFPLPVVKNAVALLSGEALYRSEKVLGVAEWFQRVHEARGKVRTKDAKANVVWLAVAGAPPGYAHVRSTMIGTLLEDLAAGLPVDDVRKKFAAKMHPLEYQRQQAAPSAGAVAQAEKIVERLASAGALARRFATLEDIEALWRSKPVPPETPAGGVFGHLKTKAQTAHAEPVEVPARTVTWAKFRDTILPTAERIEYYAHFGAGSYAALVTAVNPDAPPILQWDREDRRNRVSWYFPHPASASHVWGLAAGIYHEVTAVTLKPSLWGGPMPHQGNGVMFVIDGAQDTRRSSGHTRGGGFFPECLRAEYHEIRKVMGAYADTAPIEGYEQGNANGVLLNEGGKAWECQARVTVAGVRSVYKIDRWD